jgi:UDP-N-acetylmuramoyl-tripeptide--D-alanyl-D-alanine ligase
MQTDELYRLFLQYPQVATDTRKIRPGSIFFALKGPNFNGNHYAQQALDAGAALCITDEDTRIKDKRIILVEDSLQALQQLAKKHREQFNIPFIAITGSNGKTTTKELVQAVLSSKYTSYTTAGNLNNHIGVPLTLLSIQQDAEIAIIEMGANHLREIAGYCEYAMPTHGLITNIGKAHLEGFGSEEGIKKGKTELFDYIKRTGGTVFVHDKDHYLEEISKGIEKVISYGSGAAGYSGHIKNDTGFLEIAVTKGADLPSVKTQLVGGYNLPNILAAVCIGKTFHVEEDKIQYALESYQPSNSRSQLVSKGTNTIILDAYNANPSSMKAAIENFAHMEGDKKILVLGGMMELGADSKAEHAAIVAIISRYHWHAVALAGKDYANLPGNIRHFDTSAAAAQWFREQQFQNSCILVKGSRGMQMEKVIE